MGYAMGLPYPSRTSKLLPGACKNEMPTVPGADDTADPGEIPFNSCGAVHYRYRTLVHEAGHALGIAGGIDGGHLHMGQGRYHPHIKDSVMSYNYDPNVSCSPNPFDIMAMYALYQKQIIR